jgi:hypothetical protein
MLRIRGANPYLPPKRVGVGMVIASRTCSLVCASTSNVKRSDGIVMQDCMDYKVVEED